MTRRLLIVALAGGVACAPPRPSIQGRPAAPEKADTYWTVPPGQVTAPPTATAADARTDSARAFARDLSHLTLADVVDLSLRNNPVTRASWATALAAADEYGASRGLLMPSLTLEASASRALAIATPTRPAEERYQYGPSATLSYLVLDFGGRSGRIESARKIAVATSLTHNVTVQNTILATESAVFNHLGTRALRDAQRAVVNEATTNVAAAEDRHEVGLATIADVLQAKTALARARLDLATIDGELEISRGQVAVAMGLPATTDFDVPDLRATDSVDFISMSVDSLIKVAERARPDLAAARARVASASADVRVAKSLTRPALAFGLTTGYVGGGSLGNSGRSYSLVLGLQLPIFTGFANEYRAREASDQLLAAEARAEQVRQQVALQVLTSYSGLQTATRRVHTASELLDAALKSEEVALGRYREGVGSIVDLLIAQSALADARAQSIQTRWQWRQALAQLSHDLGTLGIRGEPALTIATPGIR